MYHQLKFQNLTHLNHSNHLPPFLSQKTTIHPQTGPKPVPRAPRAWCPMASLSGSADQKSYWKKRFPHLTSSAKIDVKGTETNKQTCFGKTDHRFFLGKKW